VKVKGGGDCSARMLGARILNVEVPVRTVLAFVAVLAITSTAQGQQSPSGSEPPGRVAKSDASQKNDKTEKTDKGDKVSTKIGSLVGCIEQGSAPNRFTLLDPANGKYQLTGSGLNRYVGQRVQILGTTDTARLRIVGGLLPSPNVAAQAGSIDPVEAAIAAQPGGPASGTGDGSLPRFKVKSVQNLSGACR
jgi:hypothetical protein